MDPNLLGNIQGSLRSDPFLSEVLFFIPLYEFSAPYAKSICASSPGLGHPLLSPIQSLYVWGSLQPSWLHESFP